MDTEIYERSNNDWVRELGQRFKEYRLRYDKTQQELAEHTGLSVVTIGKFENGSATGLTLNAFIRLLRAIGELEQADGLLPELPVSPSMLLKLQENKRKRAGRKKKDNG